MNRRGRLGRPGLRQPGHVEVAGPGSIATDADTFDTLADEAERHGQRAAERAERTKFRNGVLQGDRCRAVERARLCGAGGEKRKGGIDDVAESRPACLSAARRDRRENRGDPREQPFGSPAF